MREEITLMVTQDDEWRGASVFYLISPSSFSHSKTHMSPIIQLNVCIVSLVQTSHELKLPN